MRAALIALTAVALVVGGTPSAYADHEFTGGCDIVSSETDRGTGDYVGVLSLIVVTGSTRAMVIRCDLFVDGVVVASLDGAPDRSGYAVAATPVSYTAPDGSTTTLCTTITYDDGGPGESICGDDAEFELPPQVIIDLLVLLLDTVSAVVTNVDDPLCPVLVGLAGNYGLGTITDEGDVVVAAPVGKVWDCRPYDTRRSRSHPSIGSHDPTA